MTTPNVMAPTGAPASALTPNTPVTVAGVPTVPVNLQAPKASPEAPTAIPAAAPAPAPTNAITPTLELDTGVPVVPAPLAKVDEVATEPNKDGVVVVSYDATGNPSLDAALAFLGKQGYGPDHPAMKAASEGDFGMLKAELATKGIPGSAEYVALGEQAYKAESDKRTAQRTADTAAVMEVVGGEKSWAAIKDWASKNADPAEREAVNKGLAVGGLVAKATAKYLSDLYAKAAGTTVEPDAVRSEHSASTAPTNGALSPTQYKQEIAKLKSVRGSANLDIMPEYNALVARRQAWRE